MVDGPNDNDGTPERSEPDDSSRGGRFSGRRSFRSPGEALQPDIAPPPPLMTRKRRPIVATVSGVFSFLGIAAITLIALFSFALQKLGAPGPLTADKSVYVEGSKSDIVAQLESEGVIDNAFLMTAGLLLRDSHQGLKAGEYKFKQGASLSDVIDTLVSGKQIMHAITIPEGLTSEQVVQRLMDDDILVGSVKPMPKEGTLMPDTYKYSRGTKREQIIANMQQEQKRIVGEVWSHRTADTPIRSPYEMLTLASIVEKETGKADERPRVAGVFINRLVRNIPLQSDPTIVYGLVGGKGTLGRGILKNELEQKTPYNTYTIVGLPPGPICNPGRAAMEAVANPSRTKDIYFVADGTGGHVFAETLDQHKANVLRWRQIEKDAKDKLSPENDKVLQTTPTVTVPPKPDQRGEALPSVPIFGALDAHVVFAGRAAAGTAPPILDRAAYPLALLSEDQALSKLKPMISSEAPPAAGDGDELGGIPGVETGPPAGSAEERALAQGGGGQDITFPVSPARLADERARAAAFGLPAESGKLPPQTELISTDPAAGAVRGPTAGGRGRIFDASEGTKLDPLLNKTYDLNSAKTVPSFAAAVASPKH